MSFKELDVGSEPNNNSLYGDGGGSACSTPSSFTNSPVSPISPTGSIGRSGSSKERSRARSRSWNKFRARRAKSQEPRTSGSSEFGWGGEGGGRPVLKRERSLVDLVKTATQGSRNSVRSLVKMFEVRSISTVSQDSN